MDQSSLNKDNLPKDTLSNSYKSRELAKQNKERDIRTKKVVKGKVKTKKPSVSKRFAENFLGDDVHDVKEYLIFDVVVPNAKQLLSEMVTTAVEMILFGDQGETRNIRRDGSRSYTSYNSYYKNKSNSNRNAPGGRSRRNRSSHSFDDIIFDSRQEAEVVLDQLLDLIYQYGEARVADLYELSGITPDFTDNDFGWIDLSRASVKRIRDGYILDLPRTIELDD